MHPYRVPKRVIEHAWKTSPRTTRIIKHGSRKYKLTHTGKMVLVEFRDWSPNVFLHKIVAFPKAEHAEKFEMASKHVRNFGPAEANPGAIGTLSFRKISGSRRLEFYSAQAHAYVNKGKRQTGVPRRIFEHYAGWRYHSLRNALIHAKEKKLPFIIDKTSPNHEIFEGRSSGALKNFMAEIKRIANELDLEIIDSPTSIVIQPKK